MRKNFIWLFGENVGSTANNNSFYFWKQSVLKKDDIDKYFVMNKNPGNLSVYNTLSPFEKKFVLWKNSSKHFEYYYKADMFFVSLSYKDILPDKLLWKNLNYLITKPLIYLQHGTLGIKAIGYKGDAYNNNMFRFVYYNKDIKDTFKEKNQFRDYQLYYGIYPPRYKELVKRHKEYSKSKDDGKSILWFPTWREYFGKNYKTEILLMQMKKVLSNERLAEYLDKTSSVLTVCLHQFFDEDKIAYFKENIKTNKIKLVHAKNIDVLDELARNDVLITDYSSVGFDFTTLNKPVILYQPDLETYLKGRGLYCTIEELQEVSISKSKQLIDTIVDETYTINSFFRSRLPQEIDYDYILKGQHIDRMYDEFAEIQRNKITFLGYNFYGIGGTVFATRSLAEALLEKNYLVQLISLKGFKRFNKMPYGLQLTPLYVDGKRTKTEILKRLIPKFNCFYGNLNYDCSKANLWPYANLALENTLKNLKSKTLVSTRESLHLYMAEDLSEHIENKIYFFHCASSVVCDLYPEAFKKISKEKLPKVVFVTEESKRAYKTDLDYDNYEQSLVLGNALEMSRSVERDDIAVEADEEKAGFNGMYLVRISPDRKADLDNLLGFAHYLKEHNEENIRINVYGNGAYVNEFLETIYDNELEDYINYCGETSNPKEEMSKYDAVVDFTLNHSFGMPYIEAVLNGKMLYCADNIASREVLNGIDGCIYTSYEDLVNKIRKYPEITEEQLKSNYDKICETYSRGVLADKFIEFINK
ncbi:MAG: CDP-glycerol glycerophosphotransferase family protein [Clostridia bacterium]|nr:CDP-glycerol glycerophosphotransferase family protein [Clostridia bacterium]